MTRNKDSDIHNSHYNKFENKISRLFDDFLSDVGFARTSHGTKFRGNTGSKPSWSPAIDIVENEREYIITADVPGVKKEDIDVELHDSVLVLSGQHGQDIPSTAQAQEINIDRDNQPSKYPQSQYQQQPPQQYQQQPQPQQYQQPQQPQQPQQHQQHQQPQQPQQPQQYQQPPPQQSTEAQKFQQSVDKKYNLSNEQNQQQSTEQQPNGSQQYQHIKRRPHQESGEKFHVQERPYGYFSRSVQLPSNIRTDDDFYASLENGVLTIKIPKSNEKPKKKIAIS
jgi:HSP20 family molecular chaperone IbpA